ncbi:MAG: right-handed parallel beta-helix repeat-containing protein [Actinobacteria bacterium]|nr:right-handed parallel beta-helix repeat-containing protein [Actinomycetota bacterium]
MLLRTSWHRSEVLGTALAGLMALGISGANASPVEVIEVYPGPNALAQALAAADPGDILNIHAGVYHEAVTVSDDALTLRAAGDGPVTVDGDCQTRYVIAVRADGVEIVGLRVTGAAEGFGPFPAEIDFSNLTGGRVHDSVLRDTCDAEYGVNVFSVGGAMTVSASTASGFSDAGIYIGGITSPGATVVVRGNHAFANYWGIIVEDSAGGSISVLGNNVHDNSPAGIYVPRSDGVSIWNNSVMNNDQAGIHLTAESDDNLIARNTVEGHFFDLRDDGGSSNCWRNNVYTTSSGDISC